MSSNPTPTTTGGLPMGPPPPVLLPTAGSALSRFDFVGQAADGVRIEGMIEAQNLDNALARLGGMGLHILRIHLSDEPKSDAPGERPSKTARSLTASDFSAFNEQLAQLAVAGLPLEHGLRLIAEDMRRGRLATAIRDVAAALERGVPLGDAFDQQRGRFPNLYGRVIEAGVRSGNLGAVLIGVGRHRELVQRLRGALWRTLAYPFMVMIALGLILLFLGLYVMPRFEQIFSDFRLQLPLPTRIVLGLGAAAPYIGMTIAAIAVGVPLLWALLKLGKLDREAIDRLIVPLPIIGGVVRLSLIARWCDSLRIGVSSGMDLPASIELANDAAGSPKLRTDGIAMKEAIESASPLEAVRRRMLPATIPAAIELASGRHSLPATLESLSQTYGRQAEMRIAAVPNILTPICVIAIAISIGFVVLALFMPLISIIQGISGAQ